MRALVQPGVYKKVKIFAIEVEMPVVLPALATPSSPPQPLVIQSVFFSFFFI
jgi:hypothetical protein